MDEDRWKTVNHIFHAALGLPPSERKDFVAKAAGHDGALVEEVVLLLDADKNAGSYLEAPAVDSGLLLSAMGAFAPQLQPGDMLCERFRIVRAVSEGGMGRVFEAIDIELGVQVALKTIRPEIASSPEALARFRQEVRLARRITSANVCKTFDLERESRIVDVERGIRQELVFFSMEFLQGETLDARIKRDGALPLDEALDAARQVAAGLEAARALGVIHRDIKPANIMLVPVSAMKFRAVITDFGLARIDGPDALRSLSGIGSKASLVGTLAYMAPEQLKGEKLSPGTDIYAFGLVLFEMVTGKRTFPSEMMLSGIAQRLKGPPPDPKSIVPHLPECWRHAIVGCLRVDPLARFACATDVIAALEDVPGSRRDRKAKRSAWPRQTRLISTILILCATMALFWSSLRFTWSKPDSQLAPGALVYLPPVQNQTDERAFDNVTELIRAELAQSAQINLLDQSRVGDTLQHMTKAPDAFIDEPIAREIAMRTGAVRVVLAKVSGSSGNYQLRVDIQQPDNTPARARENWTKTFSWRDSSSSDDSATIPPNLLSAARRAGDWIRHEVGESKNDIAQLDAPSEDVTTRSWKALAAYSRAEKLNGLQKKDAALTALEGAVADDPHFALAYARMGDIDVTLGRTEDGYRAYARALNVGFDQRLTRREMDRIRGIYASDSWDYAAAEAAFRDYALFYPADFYGWFYRALPLMRLGRLEEAIATLKNAERVEPGTIYAAIDLARCYIEIGDFASARHWIQILRDRNDNDAAEEFEGILALLDGDSVRALRHFEMLRDSKIDAVRIEAYLMSARVHAERGELSQSLGMSTAGGTEAAAQGNSPRQARFLLDQAHMHCAMLDFPACLFSIKAAVSLDTSPEVLLTAGDLLGWSFHAIPEANKEQIREELNILLAEIPAELNNSAYALASMRLHAEVLADSGQIRKAIAEARRAATVDMQFRRRDQLARLLELGAFESNDAAERDALIAEARENYGRTALHPEIIWVEGSLYPPGAWADDVKAFLRISYPPVSDEADVRRAVSLLHAIHTAPLAALDNNTKYRGISPETTR